MLKYLCFSICFGAFITIQQPTYKIGDMVANFKLKNVDDRMISLISFPSAKGIILVFTSNHCPFARAYENRIQALHSEFMPKGYPVVAINPNSSSEYKEDSFERMKEKAIEHNYSFPYLLDEKGTIAQLFGITRIPQVVILEKVGDGYYLRYNGVIDDNTQDATHVGKAYVKENVQLLLNNKPILISETRPAGCAVRF